MGGYCCWSWRRRGWGFGGCGGGAEEMRRGGGLKLS